MSAAGRSAKFGEEAFAKLALSLIGKVVREGRVGKTRHLGTRQAFAFAHLFRHLCRSLSRRVEYRLTPVCDKRIYHILRQPHGKCGVN